MFLRPALHSGHIVLTVPLVRFTVIPCLLMISHAVGIHHLTSIHPSIPAHSMTRPSGVVIWSPICGFFLDAAFGRSSRTFRHQFFHVMNQSSFVASFPAFEHQ